MSGEAGEGAFGAWLPGAAPRGWELLPGQGFRRTGEGVFPANVVFTEDAVGEIGALPEYVSRQLIVLREMLPNPEISEPRAAPFPDSDEALLLEIRFTSADGRKIAQRQIYVRRGSKAGILTFTSLEPEWSGLAPEFQRVAAASRFQPAEPPAVS